MSMFYMFYIHVDVILTWLEAQNYGENFMIFLDILLNKLKFDENQFYKI